MRFSTILFVLLFSAVCSEAQDFFRPLNGPTGVSVKSCFKDANGVLYVKTDSSFIHHKSYDDGDTWTPVLINDSIQIIKLYADEVPNLFAIDSSGVLYRSDENGIDWDTISVHENNGWGIDLSISPMGDLFIAANGDLIKSQNKGQPWDSLHNEIPTYDELRFHPTGDIYGTINLGSINWKLGKSTDGGTVWSEVGIPNFQTIPIWFPDIHRLHISKQGLIIVKEGFLAYPVFESQYYISTDNGFSFKSLYMFFSIYAMLTTNDAENIIYSDVGKTVSLSKDFGATWVDISKGLPEDVRINYVYVDADQDIYLSLRNNVLYKSILPSDEITSTNAPEKEAIHQTAYPNPTNGQVTIEVGNDDGGERGFQLMDAQGKTVLEKGFTGQKFIFDTTVLPKGVHFYQVMGGQNVLVSGKIVVAD